jgi:hypothetical protein
MKKKVKLIIKSYAFYSSIQLETLSTRKLEIEYKDKQKEEPYMGKAGSKHIEI